MSKKNSIVLKLHNLCIKDTEKGAIVKYQKVVVTELTRTVQDALALPVNKIYLTSIALKHTYDKRDPMEYDFLIQNMKLVVHLPEKIYKNLKSKTGDYCFVKTVKKVTLMVALEDCQDTELGIGTYVVTGFRVKKPQNYFKQYTLVWSWEDGSPPS